MLLQIASILSSVFENRRLFTQIQERVAELAIINEVAQAVSSHLDLQQMLEAVYERVQRVMPIDAYQVSLYDADADLLSYPIMYEDGERIETPSAPLNPESITAKVIQTGDPVILSLSEEDKERLSRTGIVVGDSSQPMTASSIFVPLHLGNQIVGVMAVHSYQKDAYDQADTTLLGGIANHVAVALENARLFEQTQEALAEAERGRKEVEQRASELAAINKVAEVASTQLNLANLLDKVGETLQEKFEAASVYFALYDQASSLVTFPYFYGEEEGPILVEPKPLEGDSGFTGQIIRSRRPLLHNSSPDQSSVEDIMAHGGFVVGEDIKRTTDSYLGVPMVIGDEVIGVIGLSTFAERRVYNEADQRLLTTLAGTIGVAIQNARQFEMTRRQADREALINAISQKIQTAPTVQMALQTAVSELGQALKLKQAVVELEKTKQGNGNSHD
jgi:GAF domain-containing protein